jgi:energy-coupling factor transport system substrate-specific component
MNELPLFGLGGNVLLVVILVLLVAEEAGVPLFFIPGDLLLAVGGIAIASGQLSPMVFIPAAFIALVAGALVGWELFSRLGWDRLFRIARRLHAGGVLQHAAKLLHNAGWRAVFVSRLIPGLRIHTTQVAAVSGMPRRVFLIGLVGANVVYVAVFVGLGDAVGHPAIKLIDQGEGQAAIAILGAAVVVALFVLLRARARLALTRLQLDDWKGAFLRRPSLASLGLVPVAVGLDYSGHALVEAAHLPLFLDSIGTVLVAMIAGPWIGGIAGFITNLLSAGTIDPIAAPYCIVSLALGFAAGMAAQRDWTRWVRGGLVLWAVCSLVAAVLSTPLNLLTNHGNSGLGLGDSVLHSLVAAQMPTVLAAFLGEAVIDLPDKLITVVVAVLLAQALSGRNLSSRPWVTRTSLSPSGGSNAAVQVIAG